MIGMRKIATALPLTLTFALGVSTAAAEDMEMGATITNVNREARSLTVEFDESGATETFRIDDDTDISFTDHQRGIATLRSGFEDLRAGQDVVLEFDDEEMDGEWVIIASLPSAEFFSSLIVPAAQRAAGTSLPRVLRYLATNVSFRARSTLGVYQIATGLMIICTAP